MSEFKKLLCGIDVNLDSAGNDAGLPTAAGTGRGTV